MTTLTAESLARVVQKLLNDHLHMATQVRIVSTELQWERGEDLLQFESALPLLARGHLRLRAFLLHGSDRLLSGSGGRC